MKCIVPNCKRKLHLRGVCKVCYDASRRLIRTKKTTDAELVTCGLLKPHTWATTNLLTVALREMRMESKT